LALGQPASLALGLKSYLRFASLSIPSYALMECCKSFLQAQGIFHPATIIVIIVLPIHILLSFVLVHHTSLREDGAAIALASSHLTIGLCLVGWIWKTKAKECWGGFDKRVFNGWMSYLTIMIPCIFMYGSEWWSFEIVSLLAGNLGETPVAAQAAVSTLDMFLTMIPFASSSATMARLGNIIGESHAGIRSAIVTVRAAYTLLGSVSVLMALVMVVFRGALARVFTDDPATIELIKQVLIPMATYQVWDALQGAGGSILRALAKQHLAAGIHLVAYYIIGLPLGYYLAFKHDWNLVGLWSGQSFGLFLVAMSELVIYLFKIDWKDEMERGEKRREVGYL